MGRFEKQSFLALKSAVLLISLIGFGCTKIKFSFDYEGVLTQSNASSQYLILVNGNKATNKRIVPVEIDFKEISKKIDSPINAFRAALRKEDLTKREFQQPVEQFNVDLEDEFSLDGTKDGLKHLFVELQVKGTEKPVQMTAFFRLDTQKPIAHVYNIGEGAAVTSKNFNSVQVEAQDSGSPITHICITDEIVVPNEDNSCWSYLESSGVTPSKNLSIKNYPYIIGFLNGEYTSYLFLRDEAGNISNLSANGTGTSTQDKKNIKYEAPVPPLVTDVHAGNKEKMRYPPQASELEIKEGDQIYVNWRIISKTPISKINLYLTEGESRFQIIRPDLKNQSNDACQLVKPYTGCAILKLSKTPASYFRLRVTATDSNGQVATASSLPLNTNNFKVLAGNTDSGINGSATTAILFSGISTNQYDSDRQSFIINKKGQIVFRDIHKGLMLIDPKDGMYKVLLPLKGTADVGLISQETLSNQWAHLALAYNGEILFTDNNHVKALNLEKMSIRTVFGGGTQVAHGIAASEFSYQACSDICQIYPLPNGDIYFMSAQDFYRNVKDGARVRWYSSTDSKIYEVRPNGRGTYNDETLDLEDPKYSLGGFQIAFNEATSKLTMLQITIFMPVVGGRLFWTSNLNPLTGEALSQEFQIPPPFPHFYESEAYTNDRAGNLFSFSRIMGQIKKFDPSKKEWLLLGGNGNLGQCDDLTKASECSMDLQDVFIGLNGRVFTSDRGRIRVLNFDKTVSTLIGQSYNFGDQGLATSARFGLIGHFDFDNQGRIVISDILEGRLREFRRDETIKSIAGNGSNKSQAAGQIALNQPLFSYFWGGPSSMAINRGTGDVFLSGEINIFQLQRSTGKWQSIAGGGYIKPYSGASGSTSLDLGYPPAIIAAHGELVLSASHYWSSQSGGFSFGGNIFELNALNLLSNPILGSSAPTGTISPEGTQQNFSPMSDTFNNNPGSGVYVPTEDLWLVALKNSKRIVQLSRSPQSQIKDRILLPREIKSFTRAVKANGQEVFYYCSNEENGRVYKFIPALGKEEALPWPHNSVSCEGNRIHFDEKANSILFIIKQNSLSALAEIKELP
jgi:hypothetical protein